METTTASAPITDEEVLHCFRALPAHEQGSLLGMMKLLGDPQAEEEWTMEEKEAYSRELDERDADIEAGNFIRHEDVMKKYGYA